MTDAQAIVIGAGPAGLASAAMLDKAGIETIVLEQADTVAASWRNHYDRLHLHTDRGQSGLPGLTMPRSLPRYPARADVVAYLEDYARRFNIQPRFSTPVSAIARQDGLWKVAAADTGLLSPNVVIATGYARRPVRPTWPGEEGFPGTIIHSSAYRNAEPYAGKRVLVVGFGNSGGEIALDLVNAGVDVTLSVRNPVRIVPRDMLGLPILTWGIMLKPLPPRLADAIAIPLNRLTIGSLDEFGLRTSPEGPLTWIAERHRIPLLDIGTVAKIREGAIAVRSGIDRFESDTIAFDHGHSGRFDAVILATGYRPELGDLLSGADGVLDAHGTALVSGGPTAQPGLYFCGQHVARTGQLREIGIEARRIAADIAARMS